MEKSTPMYMLMMVGIVALVAIVYMITRPVQQGTSISNIEQEQSSMGISGNVVSDEAAPVDAAIVGRFIFGMILVGSVIYMYRQW